jgi:hypothetical protein
MTLPLKKHISFRNNTINCGHIATASNMSEEELSRGCGENTSELPVVINVI